MWTLTSKVKQSCSSPVGKSCCLQGLAVMPVSPGSIDVVMVTNGSNLQRFDGFRWQRMVLVVVQPTAGRGILLIKQGSTHPSVFQGEGRDLCGSRYWVRDILADVVIDLPQAGVPFGLPIIKVCWVICFAHDLFVPCQKSIVGRILVTSLGKYCKSKLLDWTFCWRKHRGCENWRGKDFLLLWVLVRSILGLLWVLVRYGLLGASF